MSRLIRLSCSDVGASEIANLTSVINEGYLGMGSSVEDFENTLRSFLDTSNHVVAVNSGTAALHLALQASGIGPGDEVLVPSITYVATYQAISACGAIPISCEVCRDNIFLDVSDAESRITTKTKAILPVHYASSTNGISDVYRLAEAYNLTVIEDAAHSFGSMNSKGLVVGSTEDLVCFSFDGIKNITCGEGGAVVVKSSRIWNHIKDARMLGISGDSNRRFQDSRTWTPEVSIQGWRYHMSNIFASIGLAQLSSCASRFAKRRSLACSYIERLRSIDRIQLLDIDYSTIVPHIFPILLPESIRDEVRFGLSEMGIQTGIHYYPNHLLSKYRSPYDLPVAESLGRRLLSLPLHTLLTESQQQRVVESLVSFL